MVHKCRGIWIHCPLSDTPFLTLLYRFNNDYLPFCALASCHSEPFTSVILSEAKNLIALRVNSAKNLDPSLSLRVTKPAPYYTPYFLLRLWDKLATSSRAWRAASGDRDASPQEGVSKLCLKICLKLMPFLVNGAMASPSLS